MDGPLREALDLAAEGRGQTSPNPTVGAVIVNNGEIVGRGFHRWRERDHAEIVALHRAGDRARGGVLYVTLEPCSHYGRTPPCADAVIRAGIRRVVAAMRDPNPKVAGSGFARLIAAGIDVTLDDSAREESERLNEAFLYFMRTGKPLVTVKAALTLDGKIAAPQDHETPSAAVGWITSEIARADVQRVRHFSDAILTGVGTVIDDDCLLTDRSGLPRSRPLLRIVLDSQLRMPLQSKMMRSIANDLLIVGTSAASESRRQSLVAAGARVLIADGAGGRTDIRAVLEALAVDRYTSLMVEAGSKVNWTVLDGQLADKIRFYYAPKILGGLNSLPVAGGQGRMRRADALQLHRVSIETISTDEFAVEAYLDKNSPRPH